MDAPVRHPAVVDLDAESAATLLRAVFQTGQDAIGVSRLGVIEIVNPALLRLFGYDHEEELLGKRVVDLFVPESRAELAEAMRRRHLGLPVAGFYAARAVRRDGHEMEVEIRTTSYQLQGATYAMAFLRDVSAERALLRAEEERQKLYVEMFERNTAVKLLIDPQTGQLVDANPAAERFYGWTRAELRDMRITDINTLSRDEVAHEMQAARSLRRDYFRFRHRTKSGEVRHVEVHSGPIWVGDKELLFSIVHDVTERDALEEQLRQSQRLEAIGRLAGGVAHDFNNLLTVMLNCCQMLESSVHEPIARDTLRDLNHAAERAGELTRQLLAFSRRQLLQPRPLQLNDVVRTMEGFLRRSLGPTVEIAVTLQPELPLVRADPGQIDQVVMNLALNARDAMPGGGRLGLRTHRRTLTDADGIATLTPGEYVVLSVSDSGVGMDAVTLSRVFEPFFTTKPAGQGTGLGLATAYGIVTQSGGQIFARSAPGGGSEFDVLLPVSIESEHASDSPSLPIAAPVSSEGTVLLVEDLDDLRRLLARQLRTAGFRVQEADSAETALALSDEVLSSVQALISDIVMPGKSGLELTRSLLARRPDLPVLLISGDVRNHDQSGLPPQVRFLQKPFGVGVFVRELRLLLGQSHEQPSG